MDNITYIIENPISTQDILNAASEYLAAQQGENRNLIDETRYRYAYALIRSSNNSEISRGISMIITSPNVEQVYHRAIGQTRLKKYDEALELIEQVLREQPHHEAIYLRQYVQNQILKKGGTGLAVGAALGLIGYGLYSYFSKGSSEPNANADSRRPIPHIQSRIECRIEPSTCSAASQLESTTTESRLTNQIEGFCSRNKQTSQQYKSKEFLCKKLNESIEKRLQYSEKLFIVGSTVNGLADNQSDCDMCIFANTAYKTPQSLLDDIKLVLNEKDFAENPLIIPARITLLRFKETVTEFNFKVEIKISEKIGLRNTHLLKCYTKLDDRLQPLAIVIKRWAAKNKFKDAATGTLSSYSWILMLIHFLQVGCTPPVLPCLRTEIPNLYKSTFAPDIELRDLNHIQPQHYVSNNRQTLGELLIGFFNYYGYKFDFLANVLSINDNTRKRIKGTRILSPKIYVTEPFDEHTNTASAFKGELSDLITIIRTSHEKLNKTKNLNSIL